VPNQDHEINGKPTYVVPRLIVADGVIQFVSVVSGFLHQPNWSHQKSVFAKTKFESVVFKRESKLNHIGRSAFSDTILKFVQIPSLVEVLSENCFLWVQITFLSYIWTKVTIAPGWPKCVPGSACSSRTCHREMLFWVNHIFLNFDDSQSQYCVINVSLPNNGKCHLSDSESKIIDSSLTIANCQNLGTFHSLHKNAVKAVRSAQATGRFVNGIRSLREITWSYIPTIDRYPLPRVESFPDPIEEDNRAWSGLSRPPCFQSPAYFQKRIIACSTMSPGGFVNRS
jgi:hypothetical protein